MLYFSPRPHTPWNDLESVRHDSEHLSVIATLFWLLFFLILFFNPPISQSHNIIQEDANKDKCKHRQSRRRPKAREKESDRERREDTEEKHWTFNSVVDFLFFLFRLIFAGLWAQTGTFQLLTVWQRRLNSFNHSSPPQHSVDKEQWSSVCVNRTLNLSSGQIEIAAPLMSILNWCCVKKKKTWIQWKHQSWGHMVWGDGDEGKRFGFNSFYSSYQSCFQTVVKIWS